MADILIVDDERDIRELIADILSDEGYETRMAANSAQAFGEVNQAAPDLVILDIWLRESEFDGIDILKRLQRDNPQVPVVIISGHGNIEIAVAAVKQGAYDFIEKPFNIDQLMVVVRRALETSRLRQENSALRGTGMRAPVMVGASGAFRSLRSQLEKVAKGNSRVMLTGPSGAGKEVAARFIHSHSMRAKAPFVTLNSAQIEPHQMEDVLFGRVTETGFTPGLLDQAHGGVLFIDEVADMPLGTQSKILRVLVEQQFTRVGSQDKVRVDLRVISATSRDLAQEIRAGRFREELFHRLSVVPISVPSLELRRDDIPLLAEHFISQCNAEQGLPMRELSEEATARLQLMRWPGNIRQLRNMIERVLILGQDQGPIEETEFMELDDTPEELEGALIGPSFSRLPLREARELFEREYLVTQVNRFGGNISKTAGFIGMERSALHRKLKSLNVTTSAKAGARIATHGEEGQG